MKLAGHTMGTPEYELEDAVRLFKDIGLDGIEMVVQDGYKCGIPQTGGLERARELAKAVADAGLVTSGLTPYASDYNSLDSDARARAEDDLRAVLDYARVLDAKFVRVYGGTLIAGDMENYDQKRENLVDSMQRLGEEAAAVGVALVVENHFSTMTVSAKASADIVARIDHPNVRILYDQANLTFGKEEDWETAMDLQKGLVGYVHIKDLVFKEPNAPFVAKEVSTVSHDVRNIATRIPGEGVVPWPRILARLVREGYDGWLSLEYERRWHPHDIPDAAYGMRQGAAYVRGILDTLEMTTAL